MDGWAVGVPPCGGQWQTRVVLPSCIVSTTRMGRRKRSHRDGQATYEGLTHGWMYIEGAGSQAGWGNAKVQRATGPDACIR